MFTICYTIAYITVLHDIGHETDIWFLFPVPGVVWFDCKFMIKLIREVKK